MSKKNNIINYFNYKKCIAAKKKVGHRYQWMKQKMSISFWFLLYNSLGGMKNSNLCTQLLLSFLPIWTHLLKITVYNPPMIYALFNFTYVISPKVFKGQISISSAKKVYVLPVQYSSMLTSRHWNWFFITTKNIIFLNK